MTNKKNKNQFRFMYRRRKVTVLLDKILIFRFFRSLHGRFWGLAFVMIMIVGLSVCLAIKPELISWSTAFSVFGNDVRTAPYYAGTMFFAAYALWRWRNYLKRTLKRSRPIVGLLTLTIIGFYLVALMPVSWHPWPYRIHFAGVMLVGASIAATVVVDTLLSKTRRNQQRLKWRTLRLISFCTIIIGGYITFGSATAIGWFGLSLLGELLMLIGYGTWIVVKTYQGEVGRSYISRQLKNFIIID